MSGPTRVLDASALPEGAPVAVEVGGLRLALLRVAQAIYAIDGTCPHRGGELGRGDLRGHHLYCPLHAWCFDVRTGEAFFPKGVKVARFEAFERDGGIWIALP